MATILVADDDQLLRAILRDHLEQAEHEVLEAGDGIAALDLALEERPEVLLLDVMMPLARGLEVVRRVRQQEGWHPSIVMISARTRVTDRLNALEAGADAYFEKPFEPDALLDAVERLLSDATPARYVDVLGPVWTTLAIERLADDALERRTHAPTDPEQIEEIFADLVARSIGRMPGVAGPADGPLGDAMRLAWEDAIRALLRDATDVVPVVTEVALPDALAAVERAIGNRILARQRLRLTAHPALGRVFGDVLDAALAGPPAPAPAPSKRDQTDAWTDRLRSVLTPDQAPDALATRWSAVLGDVLATPAEPVTSAATIDPLQHVWLAATARLTAAQRR